IIIYSMLQYPFPPSEDVISHAMNSEIIKTLLMSTKTPKGHSFYANTLAVTFTFIDYKHLTVTSVPAPPTDILLQSYTPTIIHGSWLDAISCPLCRQKVQYLRSCFTQSKEVLGEITAYNKRYSGAPRRLTDYLCDAPLLLQLLVRGLGTIGGLVWLFLFRVALCCVGTVMSISSSPLDASSSNLETDSSLCGLLEVLDDLVVVILLLICVININQQITPERGHPANAATSQGVMGDSL
uniref:Si:dkey-183n20.15 n=1 Tax=Amphilophus citrinellus TaxID=61819 RepID=A0A3Q0RL72_AMPCI